MINEKMYKISGSMLRQLLAESAEFHALQAAGVDNWSWYGSGFREFFNEVANEYIPRRRDSRRY